MGNVLADGRFWERGTIPFKFEDDVDEHRPSFDISAPVGAVPPGAAGNRPDDVRKVQRLLNTFSPGDGGPDPKLAEDGIMGPKTVAAIRKFQQTRFGWQDGLVDRSHATLVELTINEPDDPAPDQLKGIVLNAVHEWNRKVGNRIRWIRHTPNLTPQPNYVVFAATNDVSSSFTGVIGGAQPIRINIGGARRLISDAGRGTVKGVILHEMGHSAGLRHEHQRNDRDDWVIIETDPAKTNIAEHRRGDFLIPTDPPSRFIGCYDFCSMMHYHATQGAKRTGLTTITKRDGFKGAALKDPQPAMGNFDGLSCGDVATLQAIYPPR